MIFCRYCFECKSVIVQKKIKNGRCPECGHLFEKQNKAPIAIPFGKYKGKKIRLIAEIDPGYLAWLGRQDWLSLDIRDEVKQLLEAA